MWGMTSQTFWEKKGFLLFIFVEYANEPLVRFETPRES